MMSFLNEWTILVTTSDLKIWNDNKMRRPIFIFIYPSKVHETKTFTHQKVKIEMVKVIYIIWTKWFNIFIDIKID